MKLKKKATEQAATIRKKDGRFRIRVVKHPATATLEDLDDETVYIINRFLPDTGIKPYAAYGYDLKGPKLSKWKLYTMVPQTGPLLQYTLDRARWSDKNAILLRLPSGFCTMLYPRPKAERLSPRVLNSRMNWYA